MSITFLARFAFFFGGSDDNRGRRARHALGVAPGADRRGDHPDGGLALTRVPGRRVGRLPLARSRRPWRARSASSRWRRSRCPPPASLSPAEAHLFIMNPLAGRRGAGFGNLFSTHPPTDQRIERLQAIARQLRDRRSPLARFHAIASSTARTCSIVVRGFTKHRRATFSPSHDVGWTNATWASQQPPPPRLVVVRPPARSAGTTRTDSSGSISSSSSGSVVGSRPRRPGERQHRLDRVAVGVRAVRREREPQRQAARAPGEVDTRSRPGSSPAPRARCRGTRPPADARRAPAPGSR